MPNKDSGLAVLSMVQVWALRRRHRSEIENNLDAYDLKEGTPEHRSRERIKELLSAGEEYELEQIQQAVEALGLY
jgi:hypothetical protein